jgi:hypothetical protein
MSPLAVANISCLAVENIICAFDPQFPMIVILTGQLEVLLQLLSPEV